MRKPPSSGPIASARAETPAQVPIALPRSSAGKALVMIERVAGIIQRGADALDDAADDERCVGGGEAGGRRGDGEDVTPKRNILRRPRMSPSRPPVASSTAKESV